MLRKTAPKGFALVEIVIVLLVIVAIGLGGWYVWQKTHEDKPAKQSASVAQKSGGQNKQPEKQPDPYEGWQSHQNATYGISFKYPADWKVREGAFDSPVSATKQEYAIVAELKEEFKYNETLSIEVLNQGIDETAAWYDKYYAQAPSNPVAKSIGQLKGVKSIQYTLNASDTETRLYLFSVGNKTYLLSSINEWLNLQSNKDYWSKFDKVFDSLQI